jgi:hypothetical protein
MYLLDAQHLVFFLCPLIIVLMVVLKVFGVDCCLSMNVLSQYLISGIPTQEIPYESCIFADLVFFLHVQVRDELRKETLQLASELYFLFI